MLDGLFRAGYRDIARRLLAMREAYVAGIEAIPGMRVFGAPELSIIGFGSDRADMGSVADGMAARGWIPGLVRRPPGLHMMMSLLHEPVRERYLADLRAAVAEAAPARGASVQAVY